MTPADQHAENAKLDTTIRRWATAISVSVDDYGERVDLHAGPPTTA